MRKPLLALALLLCGGLHAQSVPDYSLGSALSVDGSTTPPTYTFTWFGKFGSHYIAATSLDLVTWTNFAGYNPSGADATLGIVLTNDAPRVFFRVFQFDPADLSTAADTDTDGLPDVWEDFYFGGLGFTGINDNEPDGFSNLEEVVAGTKPNQAPDASSAVILNLSVWTPFR